ncbi:iron ABC transporter substrate-binding protein [Eubacteriaceae bacterium ES3]|nr:iron ABC transporter substrate-binding protein [Eubacteriaceae bacterium ES3]
MKRIRFISIVLVMVMVFALSGCTTAETTESQTTEGGFAVTDVTGRTVEFGSVPETAVAIGVGALRLYTYVGNVEDLVGIEEIDQKSFVGKPYVIANRELFLELPVIGTGGPNATIDPEQILSVEPDVIFTTLATDASTADELQSKTGIPVVALISGSTCLFDDTLYQSLELIGDVTGNSGKSEEIIASIKDYEKDLNMRTEGIEESTKLTSYVGALGSKGPQGIESTRAEYPPFVAVSAKNVVDETGTSGSLMIDKEQLLEWNPNTIFIDYDGIEKVYENTAANSEYYEALEAFKNGEVYNILPYILYGTNIEVAIADAYYIGKVLYPDKFTDVEPDQIMDEVSENLLGEAVYEQMVADYGTFGKMMID